ncbi:uncharacterized protein [Palaemon carinicauda]|uniref:uncharacterized protein n=1 Tax=Palaemon carinicauda TaxID=392227 RepID=UPI0035B62E13
MWKRQRQILRQLVVIRDRDGIILHKDDDIKRRWREHYGQLLNTEKEKEELREVRRKEGLVMVIQNTEVKHALTKTENDKKPGPPEFQTKMVKILATKWEEWMLDLLEALWEEEIMPKHLVKSLMVSRCKQKGDTMECNN